MLAGVGMNEVDAEDISMGEESNIVETIYVTLANLVAVDTGVPGHLSSTRSH